MVALRLVQTWLEAIPVLVTQAIPCMLMSMSVKVR